MCALATVIFLYSNQHLTRFCCSDEGDYKLFSPASSSGSLSYSRRPATNPLQLPVDVMQPHLAPDSRSSQQKRQRKIKTKSACSEFGGASQGWRSCFLLKQMRQKGSSTITSHEMWRCFSRSIGQLAKTRRMIGIFTKIANICLLNKFCFQMQ